MSRSPHAGRHESGQNYLHHRKAIDSIVQLVAQTTGTILEIGCGRGALTTELATLPRALTAIDIDARAIKRLRRELPHVRIRYGDALSDPLVAEVVVGNVPFHLTTSLLRHMLNTGGWSVAILLVQWEVARKRAGVGGRTMMSAQYGPWFDFTLHGRVPAQHFSPRPTVDGGILKIMRRRVPLIPAEQQRSYQQFVYRVFTGRGRIMTDILARAVSVSRQQAIHMMRSVGLEREMLPRDLQPKQWARLWQVINVSLDRR